MVVVLVLDGLDELVVLVVDGVDVLGVVGGVVCGVMVLLCLLL